MTRKLWALRKETRAADDDLVFTGDRGGRVVQPNVMSRVLKPAGVRAGVGDWLVFHTFRHTCATVLLRSGWNAVQVEKFLGHADPGFTLRRYVHLLDEDLPVPGVLARTRHAGDNAVVTRPTENDRDARVVAEVR